MIKLIQEDEKNGVVFHAKGDFVVGDITSGSTNTNYAIAEVVFKGDGTYTQGFMNSVDAYIVVSGTWIAQGAVLNTTGWGISWSGSNNLTGADSGTVTFAGPTSTKGFIAETAGPNDFNQGSYQITYLNILDPLKNITVTLTLSANTQL